ncbi:hypothetical protein [Streptomyces griseiscabiei]|uniref:Uncharacterized protein n=1 Tax=Streptomyces griseiscabiei TaxID=2993540 RepID=A0ABU4KXH2_9ACTN|nr:hypothetical protein [Streptomyces griseiscabiei]MBZ3904402.1 hypothetical protein [Streptomyces griseiscabiei]MDX2908149.1 hypothetical protein [Streptomyces griseiscabiei]
MTVTQADIDTLTASHPQLSGNGYGPSAFAPTPVTLDEVQAAHAWIAEQPWLNAPGEISSYTHKHAMETTTGTYVSNGAFIAAALLHAPAGLKVKLDDLNPAIGIKRQG